MRSIQPTILSGKIREAVLEAKEEGLSLRHLGDLRVLELIVD